MPGTNYDDGTKSVLRTIGGVLLAGVVLVALVGVLVGVLLSGGCAAGRGPGGEVIVGFDVAKLPETASESLNAAADFLPPPFNYLAGGIATLVLGGGGAAIARRRAEQAKREADAAWDESNRNAELAHARRDAAFDEGTQRAASVASVAPAARAHDLVVPTADSRTPVVAAGVAPATPGA